VLGAGRAAGVHVVVAEAIDAKGGHARGDAGSLVPGREIALKGAVDAEQANPLSRAIDKVATDHVHEAVAPGGGIDDGDGCTAVVGQTERYQLRRGEAGRKEQAGDGKTHGKPPGS